MQRQPDLNRRRFLTVGAGTALAATLGAPQTSQAERAPETPSNATVKFSLFADLHHCPGSFYSEAPRRLKEIQERAVREKCSFIIHCGDFCHNPKKEREFVESYQNFEIPSYHTCGNHDFDGCSDAETFAAYKLDKGYYYFDRDGFRFVVLDGNYFRNDDGTFAHYANGNYFKYKGSAISIIPPDQLAWFAETLSTSPFPCATFIHQSFERERGGVANWREIREIIDGVNKKTPGRVRLCCNGHHHRDFIRILNDVVYFDVNSTTHEWLNVRHNLFPKELCDQADNMNHTVLYNDPVHAVVTMSADGSIEIAGMESSMFMGVTPEKAGANFADSSGRPVFPSVQSFKAKFSY